MKSIICLSLLLGFATLTAAPSWPQFLGPQRSGVAEAGEKVVAKFPEDGPKISWKFECGSGFAGPIVADGFVYLFHRVKNEARLEKLLAGTGKVMWSFSYETDYKDSFGFDDGPRACPTLADGKVFIYGAEGMMHAVDAGTGKAIWKRNLAADFDSEQGFFGRAGSPLVYNDEVMVNPGGSKGSVVALNARTGVTSWVAGKQAAGYASPITAPFVGDRCGLAIVSFLREGLLGVAAKTGEMLFEAPFRATMEASVNAATPLVISPIDKPLEIFTTASYGTGAALWKYEEGKLSAVWKSKDVLDCHYATPVFADGFIYGMHGRQEQGQELRCIEAATGKLKWSSPKMAAGEFIAADGKLIVVTDRGECILVARDPEKFTVLDRGQILSAGHRSPPALAGGVLYVRDKEKLVAVGLGE